MAVTLSEWRLTTVVLYNRARSWINYSGSHESATVRTFAWQIPGLENCLGWRQSSLSCHRVIKRLNQSVTANTIICLGEMFRNEFAQQVLRESIILGWKWRSPYQQANEAINRNWKIVIAWFFITWVTCCALSTSCTRFRQLCILTQCVIDTNGSLSMMHISSFLKRNRYGSIINRLSEPLCYAEKYIQVADRTKLDLYDLSPFLKRKYVDSFTGQI